MISNFLILLFRFLLPLEETLLFRFLNFLSRFFHFLFLDKGMRRLGISSSLSDICSTGLRDFLEFGTSESKLSSSDVSCSETRLFNKSIAGSVSSSWKICKCWLKSVFEANEMTVACCSNMFQTVLLTISSMLWLCCVHLMYAWTYFSFLKVDEASDLAIEFAKRVRTIMQSCGCCAQSMTLTIGMGFSSFTFFHKLRFPCAKPCDMSASGIPKTICTVLCTLFMSKSEMQKHAIRKSQHKCVYFWKNRKCEKCNIIHNKKQMQTENALMSFN